MLAAANVWRRMALCLVLAAAGAGAQAEVRVGGAEGRELLLRNGQPFPIRGAAAFTRLDLFRAIGGNTLRIFGPEHDFLLPEAQRLGLGVIYGFDLGLPQNGFDYGNPAAVAAQEGAVLARVAQLKSNPAVLIWALGNEVELKVEDAAPVFRALNQLARRVKAADPAHPTMVVVAEVWQEKIDALKRWCPDVDILGINSYGGAVDAAARARRMGWTRPIVITEFGAPGHWEMPVTAWHAPIEPTSGAKAGVYDLAWRLGVESQPGVLGGVAFLWGAKYEMTPTWYGMLLADGARLAPVDVLARLWKADPPLPMAPRIDALRLVDAAPELKPGQVVQVEALPGEPLPRRYRWELRLENDKPHSNRDGQVAPPAIPGAVQGEGPRVRLVAPATPGAYRLYVYGYDDADGAATANLPIRVQP